MSNAISTEPEEVKVDTTNSQWNSDVMDCCKDTGICICGALVPCILACKVATDYGECCCVPFLPGGLLAMRTGIRERYHIPGTICNDCVCHTFCGQCTLCQMARELNSRK